MVTTLIFDTTWEVELRLLEIAHQTKFTTANYHNSIDCTHSREITQQYPEGLSVSTTSGLSVSTTAGICVSTGITGCRSSLTMAIFPISAVPIFDLWFISYRKTPFRDLPIIGALSLKRQPSHVFDTGNLNYVRPQ